MSSILTEDEILGWLVERDESRLGELWRWADEARADGVGDEVHLRGLIEFSNVCQRQCAYCGLRAGNDRLTRYKMSKDEIMDCVESARAMGCRTIVLQSGECEETSAGEIADIVRSIKAGGEIAVTLSLGERSAGDCRLWRDSGADRYLLKFETSDADLYRRLHPPGPGRTADRLELLKSLKRMGYEVGSGIMVGLPGQTWRSLARDIELFKILDLDMVAVGPFLPHPGTPLGNSVYIKEPPAPDQVPNTELVTRKVLALARLLCPKTHIPATTALAVSDSNGYEKALACGANVIMINVTPDKYRKLYEIYPNTTFTVGGADQHQRVLETIKKLNRRVGKSLGGRSRS